MPFTLSGFVALRIERGREADNREAEVPADAFTYQEGGIRLLDDEHTRHEATYRYTGDAGYDLVLITTAINGMAEPTELAVEGEKSGTVQIVQNAIKADFQHDPDLDDEPLTPVSSN
ncbi:hypothetical protein [Billgrantia endophytica]|uniref:Uncharacterized protein n=1 Tax=Billgrantia endophytica TaxID=2033802 RepID=A0A2N7TX30_9GAMM|nr:hypothetical protein [Halomonas endophytica]PMR72731.1 hypothetical protein C1H69_19995 [Halomonas endophytica]